MKNQVFLTKQLLNKLNFFFQQSFSKIKFTNITVLDIFAAKGSSLNIFTNRKPSRFVEMKFFLFEKNFSLKKNVIKNYYTVFSKAKHRRVFFYNVDVFKFDFYKLKNWDVSIVLIDPPFKYYKYDIKKIEDLVYSISKSLYTIKYWVFIIPYTMDGIQKTLTTLGYFLIKIFNSLGANSRVYIYSKKYPHPVGDLNPCCWNENPVS